MNELLLNGLLYPLKGPKHTTEEIDQAGLTPYEAAVLRFCDQWLAQKESFTLPTSGSTGKSKTITLSREQMIASAHLTGQALDLQPGDKALVCLPVEYIAGMMMLVRGFVLDLNLTIVTPSGNPLAGFPADTHFDFTALVPLQIQQILAKTPQKRAILDRMKAILVGGGPISAALLEQLQNITAPIYHTYGMTETATHIALKPLNGPQASDYFIPLPGVEVKLDERGCLMVKSAVTGDKTLYTNDLVDLQPDGSFRWLGRIDNVINSGGIKVHPEKVEAALETVLGQLEGKRLGRQRFFVGPVADDRLGQAVVMVVEGKPFSPEIEAEIRTALLKILSKYEAPRQFYYLPRFSETPTGKIERRATLENITKSTPGGV
jgi:O-succinylbenzoic acid--CoA ligase